MTGATVHGPGEGERHSAGAGSTILIEAAGADTGDSFFLSETTIAPGFAGPLPHRHDRLYDMFYVLEGTLTMRLGDETRSIEAGAFVCAPPGVTHTFSNPGTTAVRFLNFNTPAGWEHYMRELGVASQKPTDHRHLLGQLTDAPSALDLDHSDISIAGAVPFERQATGEVKRFIALLA